MGVAWSAAEGRGYRVVPTNPYLDPLESIWRPFAVEQISDTADSALPQLPSLRADYRCPNGDVVSEAIHNARLIADDPICVGCRHGHSTAKAVLEFDGGNVRARYHNVLHRALMRTWGTALSRTLGLQHQAEYAESGQAAGRRPLVVAGYDERESSPDLVAGLDALLLGGCDVVDVGCTLRPLVDFAVRKAGAEAGVFVTGGERLSGWNGLDVVARGARSWSWPGLAQRACEGAAVRQSRTSGQRSSRAVERHYLNDLRDLAHGFRPLTVVLLTQSSIATRLLTEQAVTWPGRVLVEQISGRDAEDVEATIRSLRYQGFPASDLAVLMSNDARSVLVADESGTKLTAAGVARGLSELDGGERHVTFVHGETEQRVDETIGFDRWVVDGERIAGPDASGMRRRDAFWLIQSLLERLAVSDAPASNVFVD